MLEKSNKKHDDFVKFFLEKDMNPDKIVEKIKNLNSYPEMKKKVVKTVLALDATCSMTIALKQVLSILDEAFDEINLILKKFQAKGTFEMKLLIYRNYNSNADMILEKSAYEVRPENLKKFLKKVSASGGWGP